MSDDAFLLKHYGPGELGPLRTAVPRPSRAHAGTLGCRQGGLSLN